MISKIIEIFISWWYSETSNKSIGVWWWKKIFKKVLEIYKEQLDNGYIQVAYLALTKYVAELKSNFPKKYCTGNISFGYLDYTYFSFFNTFLRDQKLRFGVVLNHRKMQI